MTWAEQVEDLCKRIGSQAEAARAISYSEAEVSYWISGDREPPRRDWERERILELLEEKAE